ncbi:MAG TPA: class I SAM-dependent methyltransferase [Ohtaekwangia sp.]|nr:class I SAM-dependent methyltransferase [Ohtaekwangia sp.]
MGTWRRFFLRAAVLRKNAAQKLIARLFPAPQFEVFRDLNLQHDTRILDVGCGSGYKFLYPLAEIGFRNLMGCDPYISAPIHYPNGLSIVREDIFKMAGEWDLITFHHSFEHVANPLQNLQKVKTLLAENAVCVLRIPTVSSYAWKKYRTSWVQLDAPRHFFIHSRKSIEYLARQAGLRLCEVRYDSTHFQFSASEGYLQNIPLVRQGDRKPSLFGFLKRKIKKLVFTWKARALNRRYAGDQAAFFLSH